MAEWSSYKIESGYREEREGQAWFHVEYVGDDGLVIETEGDTGCDAVDSGMCVGGRASVKEA